MRIGWYDDDFCDNMIMLCWWLYDTWGDPAGGRWLLLGWWRAPCPRGSVILLSLSRFYVMPTWIGTTKLVTLDLCPICFSQGRFKKKKNICYKSTKGLSMPVDFSMTTMACQCWWWQGGLWTGWQKTRKQQQQSCSCQEQAPGSRQQLFRRPKVAWGPDLILTVPAFFSLGSRHLSSCSTPKPWSGRRWAARRQGSWCTPQFLLISPAFANDQSKLTLTKNHLITPAGTQVL